MLILNVTKFRCLVYGIMPLLATTLQCCNFSALNRGEEATLLLKISLCLFRFLFPLCAFFSESGNCSYDNSADLLLDLYVMSYLDISFSIPMDL